jgi:transposase
MGSDAAGTSSSMDRAARGVRRISWRRSSSRIIWWTDGRDTTIYRTKKRFVMEGLEASLEERPGRGASRMLTKREEAKLVALACSSPPAGRRRWTLELLADEFVRLVEHDSISRETIRRRLEENELKPWQRKMWCIPKVDAEYVARMEDVLDLYMEPADEKRPVVSFDETPTQLIGEARVPVPQGPGRPARMDYEYRRKGTANLFVFVDAHRAWRHVKVTDQRTNPPPFSRPLESVDSPGSRY